MLKKQILALALLAASATLVHAADDTAKKDPKTGKNCVTFISSETGDGSSLVRMNFRNTCDSPFEIRITAGESTRKKNIEAATTGPTKAYVTCKSSDGCQTAKWQYE